MATLQNLIDSVDILQESVTTLTTEVNVRKQALDNAVGNAESSKDQAIVSAQNAASSESTASTQAGISTAQASIATSKASEATTSENNAAQSEINALTYKNQAEEFRDESSTILSDIQALLPNFPNAFIFALNKRLILEGATVTIKLRYMRDVMKNELGFSN